MEAWGRYLIIILEGLVSTSESAIILYLEPSYNSRIVINHCTGTVGESSGEDEWL